MASRTNVLAKTIVFILVHNLVLLVNTGKSEEHKHHGAKIKRAIVPIGSFYQPPQFNQYQYPSGYGSGYGYQSYGSGMGGMGMRSGMYSGGSGYGYSGNPRNYYRSSGGGYSSAALQYFSHMQGSGYPPEILAASQRVMAYLSQSQSNFNGFVGGINSIQGLNPMDKLVAFLLRIQGSIPMDCSISSDISTLILYNMMKSYLHYVPVMQGSVPTNADLYMMPTGDAMKYREIIKVLVAKYRCCEGKVSTLQEELSQAMMQMANTRMQMANARMQMAEITATPVNTQTIAAQTVSTPVIPELQVRLLEEATVAPQIEIRYIDRPCPTLPPTTTTMMTTTISPYLAYIDVIPKPSTAFEKTKYERIVALFQRADLGIMLGHVDLSGGKTDLERFYIILKATQSLELEQAILDAIKYYLSLQQSQAALKLSMQKEIKKQFELTKIFTATFNFESLSAEAKVSFDAFFNFLLGVTGEQMSNFTEWTEIKTKGEFMKVLFEFFLTQSFTPIEVKEAIQVLQPFVLLTGEGAESI